MPDDLDARSGRPGIMARLAERAALAVHDLRERHRLRIELAALERDGTLDRVLAEARLSHADLEPMLSNHPASGRLLAQMAERLRIGDRLHDDAAERDMWRVCTLCESQGRCKHWLASGATEGYEDFCPNSELLNQMRVPKAT